MRIDTSGQDYPPEGKRTKRKGTALRILGCGGITLLVLGTVYLFLIGRSTLAGWRVAADSLPEILSKATTQRQLPSGSRVVFENTAVGVLVTQQTQLRQQAHGGDLLLFDGQWEEGAITAKAMGDSTLIGIVQTDSTTGVVEIELRSEALPRNDPPLGLLRLRPFRHGYRLYRRDRV